MNISTQYAFTAVNAHDLLDKIKSRLEAINLTTVLYTDSIIDGITVGKRLHVQVGSSYLNFASAIQIHPIRPSDTGWTSSTNQVVAATISRTFNQSNIWSGNESVGLSVPAVQLKNNSQCWIFTTNESICIVTNYDNIYYTALYINLDTANVFLSANKMTALGNNGLNNFSRLFTMSSSSETYKNMFINSGNFYAGLSLNYEISNTSVDLFKYTDFYNKMFNLVNNSSIILPENIYFRNESNNSLYLIKALKDIGMFNMKNTEPKYVFTISNKQYIVFPENFRDASSDSSMGLCFRIA